jgi:hypothetical protein
MASVPEAKLALVRALIERTPDRALKSLLSALGMAEDGPMLEIRDLAAAEANARKIGRAVFFVISPLFEPANRRPGYPNFPTPTPALLWRAVRRLEPDLASKTMRALQDRRSGDLTPRVVDRCCVALVDALRRDPKAVLCGVSLDVDQLIACLELSPVAREAAHLLPTWLGRPGEAEVAALKVVYKDASAIRPDGGPLLTAILSAHLPEPHLALRVVSMIMDRPSDSYLAGSELSVFADRLFEMVENALAAVRAFDPSDAAAARAAAQTVPVACGVFQEFEESLELGRRSAWGQRLTNLRHALAAACEKRVVQAEEAVEEALPYQGSRVANRVVRNLPRLDAPPAPEAVVRARALMAFLDATHGSAAVGGFGAARNRVAAAISERLTLYAEELFAVLNAGECPNVEVARTCLDLAAEFIAIAESDEAGQLMRRRAAMALAVESVDGPSQAVA